MPLSSQQITQIQAALLNAYDESGLRQMLRTQMDVRLDHVTGGDNLTDIVFNLIGWAERTGNVQRLIEAAVASNETNALLQALVADTQGWPEHAYEPSSDDRPAELAYLADLTQRYQFWAEKYTPLAGIAEVRTAPAWPVGQRVSLVAGVLLHSFQPQVRHAESEGNGSIHLFHTYK